MQIKVVIFHVNAVVFNVIVLIVVGSVVAVFLLVVMVVVMAVVVMLPFGQQYSPFILFCLTQVIGDKKGTSTSHVLRNPRNLKLLNEIQRSLKTKLKFIHVIRNPFDNIATKLLRNLDSRDMARDESFKVST